MNTPTGQTTSASHPTDVRALLTYLFQSGIQAVQGQHAVAACIKDTSLPRPSHILAVGKAASSMLDGVPEEWSMSLPTLLVTKQDHLPETPYGENVTAMESDHPVPSERSLIAGASIRAFVEKLSPADHLLFLVSGGASALAEDLVEGISFADLTQMTQTGLTQGDDIATMNAERSSVSRIKGGKLLAHCAAGHVDAIAISDVEGDDIGVIGSGIASTNAVYSGQYHAYIAASNAVARKAIATTAANVDLSVQHNTEQMYANVQIVADRIALDVQNGPAGLYIFGGEPTVILPTNPGHGGRNQALALELARRFAGSKGVQGLVAGTDGTDGPTIAAGGFFDGHTFDQDATAVRALKTADSGTYLARVGDQFVTGPTGTNVMDVAIIYKTG